MRVMWKKEWKLSDPHQPNTTLIAASKSDFDAYTNRYSRCDPLFLVKKAFAPVSFPMSSMGKVMSVGMIFNLSALVIRETYDP